MNKWRDGQTDRRWMAGWMDGRTDGQTDGQTDGRTDRWMDCGWKEGGGQVGMGRDEWLNCFVTIKKYQQLSW